jgi:hypothetical protein
MIGEVIESRRAFPWGVLTFLVLAALSAGAGLLSRQYGWVTAAVLPLAVAGALALTHPGSLSFEFTEEGIQRHDRDELIPYAEIVAVIAPGRPGDLDRPVSRPFPIRVVHEHGTLHVPAKINVPSDEVFRFLLDTFPDSGSPRVNPALRDYLDRQVELFGADRVRSYRARAHLGDRPPGRGVAVSLAGVLAGLVWLAVGVARNETGWVVGGIMLAMCGGMLALIFWLTNSRYGRTHVKNWQKASLVVSPLGLALVQGDLRGEMRWDELTDLRLGTKPHSFTLDNTAAFRGIRLTFPGAEVVIADIYDRPLHLIYKQIRSYWKRPDEGRKRR